MEQIQGENRELLQERYGLVLERIREIGGEPLGQPALDEYFGKLAAFSLKLAEYYAFAEQGHLKDGELARLQDWNRELFEDVLPEHYGHSWGNPAYAAERMGEQWGQLLSYVYVELRGCISSAAEGEL